MPLTDTHIRNLKPDVKPRKYFDGGGLFLFIPSNGSKLWKMAYRFDGKSKLLSFREYPQYRSRTPENAVKKQSACCPKGFDPSDYKRELRRARAIAERDSFQKIARDGMKHAWPSFPKNITEPLCTSWRRTSFRPLAKRTSGVNEISMPFRVTFLLLG